MVNSPTKASSPPSWTCKTVNQCVVVELDTVSLVISELCGYRSIMLPTELIWPWKKCVVKKNKINILLGINLPIH